MRTYKNITFDQNRDIITMLQALSLSDISVEEYRRSFYLLGKALGVLLNKKTDNRFGETMISCASEDADWLVQGVLDVLSQKKVSLAVFWNERIVSNAKIQLDFSTITRSYIEPIDNCQTLILVKSIISTSCVVRTQLTHLINSIHPKVVYIVSPVMYKDAERSLYNEFPESIAEKFQFLTFAIDSEKSGNNVIPGVGGSVYPRLGSGDAHEKNKYIPNIVKSRMGL